MDHVLHVDDPRLKHREESDEELNIKARLPAWAKGKSVMMELSEKRIRLSLREERDKPIIEVKFSACSRRCMRARLL